MRNLGLVLQSDAHGFPMLVQAGYNTRYRVLLRAEHIITHTLQQIICDQIRCLKEMRYISHVNSRCICYDPT